MYIYKNTYNVLRNYLPIGYYCRVIYNTIVYLGFDQSVKYT